VPQVAGDRRWQAGTVMAGGGEQVGMKHPRQCVARQTGRQVAGRTGAGREVAVRWHRQVVSPPGRNGNGRPTQKCSRVGG